MWPVLREGCKIVGWKLELRKSPCFNLLLFWPQWSKVWHDFEGLIHTLKIGQFIWINVKKYDFWQFCCKRNSHWNSEINVSFLAWYSGTNIIYIIKSILREITLLSLLLFLSFSFYPQDWVSWQLLLNFTVVQLKSYRYYFLITILIDAATKQEYFFWSRLPHKRCVLAWVLKGAATNWECPLVARVWSIRK